MTVVLQLGVKLRLGSHHTDGDVGCQHLDYYISKIPENYSPWSCLEAARDYLHLKEVEKEFTLQFFMCKCSKKKNQEVRDWASGRNPYKI